jgi:hypothetical protein
MYARNGGRPVRILTQAFGLAKSIEKATDLIVGIRVRGIVKPDNPVGDSDRISLAKNGVKCITLQHGSLTKPKFITAFEDEKNVFELFQTVKDGDILNVEGFPMGPVFTTKDGVAVTPRGFKALRAEAGTQIKTETAVAQ